MGGGREPPLRFLKPAKKKKKFKGESIGAQASAFTARALILLFPQCIEGCERRDPVRHRPLYKY